MTKPPESVHRAGETVKGILEYTIDERTKYKNISISLIGKGKFDVSKGAGDNERNYNAKEYYIQRTINVLNKRPDYTVTLPLGSYSFPFEFHLPYDLPSSYSSKSDGKSGYVAGSWEIKYYIRAVFEKPSVLSRSKTFESNLIIYGFVETIVPEGPIVTGIKKSITRINPISLLSGSGKELIHLKATIAKAYILPGETIKINYEVHNDSDVYIKKIITCLKQRTTLTENHVKNTLEYDVKDYRSESPSIRNKTEKYIEASLPTKPELYSIHHSNIINVEYFVKITLNLPVPHKNASLEIPITIGQRHGQGALDVLELNNDNSGIDPPSYKQAMSADNAR